MSEGYKGSRHNRILVDEGKLIELIRCNPVLYDPGHKQANDVVEIEEVWIDIAEKLNAPVHKVKKTWEDLTRSRNRRASLRSSNLNFLPVPSRELSNDNSCASSNCSLSKGNGKRSTRSVSELSTASEPERTRSSLTSSTATLPKQKNSRRSRKATPIQDDASTNTDTVQSAESSIIRYLERSSSANELPRTRLSESSFLSSKEVLQSAVSSAPRHLSNTPNGDSGAKNITAESIRAFFESMAMTVSTFPQHIQATIKLQICKIVEETEYGLSMPK